MKIVVREKEWGCYGSGFIWLRIGTNGGFLRTWK
jgi:hypothetical protein